MRHRAEVVTTFVLVVPLLLWALAFGRPTIGELSILFALLGTTSFALSLVLTARLRSIERRFGGLDRIYRFHQRLAVATVAFLLVHAALVGAGLPAFGGKVLLGGLTLAGLIVLLSVSFFARDRMSHETFIRVQRIFGLVFAMGAVHALVFSGTLPLTPVLRAYLVAVFVLGLAAFVYRSVLGRFAVPRYTYRVESVTRLDDSVVTVDLSPIGTPMRFRAGQFAFLGFDGGVSPEAHPFSIASAPDDRLVRFLIKALGDWTTAVQRLEPGGTARLEGPYGGFWDAGADNARQVWIAGGVGIAAFLSMARALDIGAQDIDLYYCSEGPEQAHLIDELFEIADRNPRLRVIPIRKRSLGRIDGTDIEGASRGIASKDVFICGPPAMMRNLDRDLRALGVPRSQIHFEDFSFM